MLRQLFTRISTNQLFLRSSFDHCKFISHFTNSTPKLLQKNTNFILNNSSQRFLSDRRFSEKHEWVLLDSNDKSIGTIGISQHAQEALGDVVYVQLPDVNAEFIRDAEVGAIESVKAANEIYTPVSGTIVETNKKLEEKPGLINSSCYDEGWLFKIKIKDHKELDDLMDEKRYEEYLTTAH